MRPPPRPSIPEWILRAALVASSAAYVVWMWRVNETPLLGWMWSPSDVGGLELGEPAALLIQRSIAVALGLMGISLLWRAWAPVLWGFALFQFVWATAMSQKQEGYPLDLASWDETPFAPLAPLLILLFPYATEAARIALPLCLWRIVTSDTGNSRSAEWTARTAIAITFAAHGIEAIQHYPPFIDMILVSFANAGIQNLSESSARSALTVIGAVDLLCATLAISTRWPPVAAYMGLWGFTTAAARILMRGWETGLLDFGVRVAHFALPLVLLLWWYKTHPLPPSPPPPVEPR